MHIPHLQPSHLARLQSQSSSTYLSVLLLTLIPLYVLSYSYRVHHPWSTTSSRPPSTNFTGDWMSTSLIQPYNPSPLRSYCSQTKWRPNLILNLADANGGIGNVRGNILDFLMYAIEAGASIYLPGMATRSPDNLSNMWGSRAEFANFFDEELFIARMQEACPQMNILRGKEIEDALQGTYVLKTRRMDESFANTKQAFVLDLKAWVDARADQVEAKGTGKAVMNVERTLWNFDTRSLPLGLRRNFGQVLRIKPEIRALAAVVIDNIAERFHLPIDPRDAVPRGAFYGAHLRVEKDAETAGWLSESRANFTVQTDSYLERAVKHGLRVIYAASGDLESLDKFKAKGIAHIPAIQVVTKMDLLEEGALNDLTWDQQALVDWEVLQRCSVFGGFVKSSFSFNIGLARGQWLDDGGVVVEPYKVQHDVDGIAYDDGISRLLDRDEYHEHRIPRGMWP